MNQSALINMIKQQLRTGNVLDERILNLYDEIPRHDFVPAKFIDFAYSDMQIPLNHEQRMMTPLEEALLLQGLQLTGNETVLEVGTGSGFLTALLSRLAKKVISIDYYADLTTRAAEKLRVRQCDNVQLITGDACRGWLELAPYDVIVFSGAIEALTKTHCLQLLPGGRMFVLIGNAPVMQGQLHQLDHDENWSSTVLFETELPALIDKLKLEDFVF